jgi:hypothetical protein
MAREKDCSKHEVEASAGVEGTEKLKQKWWRRKE